ncbi:V-type ATP synthase subunit F [uncultured archaeon]|nr:V-type ATP synthase subunit F [uncultured archaeon]
MNIIFVGPKILCEAFKISGVGTLSLESKDDYDVLLDKLTEKKPSLVVYDSSIYKKLDAKQKKLFDSSVSPVFIELSQNGSSNISLKDLVRNAIGIEIK